MSIPPSLTCRVDSRLQYDYSASSPAHWSLGAIDGEIRDELSLQLYFIQGSTVIWLRQFDLSSTNAVPDWIVTDTAFPAAPVSLHTIVLPLGVDIVIVVSDVGDVWFLKRTESAGSGLPPHWKNMGKPDVDPEKYRTIDARPFLDKNGTLLVAALISSKEPIGGEFETNFYLIRPDDDKPKWEIDTAVDISNFVIKEFIPHAIFGSTSNNSNYGFLVSGDDVAANSPGIAILTGGTPVLSTTPIAKGAYDSLSFVRYPFLNTPVVIFALDSSTRTATAFSYSGGDYYNKTEVFPNVPLRQIQSVLRANTDVKPYTIEIFAVSDADQILHSSSEPFDQQTFHADSSLRLRRRTPIAINTQSMFLASSPAGFVAMMIVNKDGSWSKMTQDSDTTTWNSQVISEPALENVEKQRVYYTEIALEDENYIPAIGVPYELGCNQYATIVVNGCAVAINPFKQYRSYSNGMGKVTITIPASSLAVPTLTFTANKYAQGRELDIQGMMGTRRLFSTITPQQLKDATNQETGNKVLQASDPELKSLAATLNGLMNASGPLPASSDLDSAMVGGRAMLSSEVAFLRASHEPSLGYISGGIARHGFRVHFGDDDSENRLRFESFQGELPIAADGDPAPLPLDIPWGDLFLSIQEKFYLIVTITVKAVANGVKVTLDLVSDGVSYVWDGVVRFIRQVFDVVEAAFAKVRCVFADLFGWFAELLDWKEVTRTADIFKGYVSNFPTVCQEMINNVLPLATSKFFNDCADKVNESVDTTETKVGDEKLGKYDTAGASPAATEEEKKKDPLQVYNTLPSSVTWLQSKFFDSADGLGLKPVDTSLDTLTNLTTVVENSLLEFYSPDIKKAFEAFITLIQSFVLRKDMDNVTITTLLDNIKDGLKLVLKNMSAVVTAITNLVKEAAKSLLDLLRAPLWPSGIGAIFKDMFSIDLTIENAMCYAIAVPFTIMHKIIVGCYPSQTNVSSSASVSKTTRPSTIKRSPILWRGILAIIQTGPDMMLDLMGIGAALGNLGAAQGGLTKISAVPKAIINGSSMLIPMIDIWLLDPITMFQSGSPRKMVAASIPTITLSCTAAWFALTRLQRGPRGSLPGQIFLFTSGLLGIGAAVWYVVEVGADKVELVAAQFLRPLSPVVKILRAAVDATKQPKIAIAIGATMLVVDGVSGVAGGTAMILAGKD
ncbi:hypothetical protein R3P38DRAFT_3451867 [Favolaschia claudopus]|uniref:Uncharacterized protein n=1 Tax=Favolaschia claudopus TaxID=2862362 RepID=A0AAV9ZL13_9AGAR